MKNHQEQINYFKYKNFDQKYHPQIHQQDPEWQFQKVQSVYKIMNDGIKKGQVIYKASDRNQVNRQPQYERTDAYNKRFQPQISEDDYNYLNIVRMQRQNKQKNGSVKSNLQTNFVSQNQSMEYLSSQQPSFSNKGQFTVFQDFNLNDVSPVKKEYNGFQKLNVKKEWQTVSFAPPNQNKLNIKQKCVKMFEYIQELKFMKEGLQSRLKQQKITFVNSFQEIKKFLFQLNIKYEKQILELSKEKKLESKQSSVSKISLENKSNQQNLQKEIFNLKRYCQKIEQQKLSSEQKYQNTLKIYQQQIEIISRQLQKRVSSQQSSHSYLQQKCANCIQSKGNQIQSYEIQIWKNRLRQQQEKHSSAMRRLEQKVFTLQQQFQALANQKTQTQKNLKQKQRSIVYKQSQIQYRLKDIQKRQRQLQMNESMLVKQREEVQRKKEKITEYELRVLKEQKKHKTQLKQRQVMSSQYFNNIQKRRLLGKSNVGFGERSDSVSSKGSRIDINTRLRQIQMMKNQNRMNYMQNGTSRKSSNDSRFSGTKQINSPRGIVSNNNFKSYGTTPNAPNIPTSKQSNRQSSQMIKLSQKLNILTQTLQKQLREIN